MFQTNRGMLRFCQLNYFIINYCIIPYLLVEYVVFCQSVVTQLSKEMDMEVIFISDKDEIWHWVNITARQFEQQKRYV